MPWYKVDYACPLNLSQMDEIATAITNIHSQHFKTPKIFVNVRVKDISTANVYVGGRKWRTNRIVAQVRGGSRSREDFEKLCGKIVSSWDEIVQVPPSQVDCSGSSSLHAISIQACISAGYEGGFYQPAAGGDQDWVSTHWKEFTFRAGQGDQFAFDLVENISNDPNFVQSAKN